jgi:hypothetical protein
MFIGSGIWDSARTPAEEESLFYHGYGQADINQDVIAYCRFERIIQDIGEYCEHVLMSDEGGDNRMQCFEHLQPVFLPNGAIERAYDSYLMRGKFFEIILYRRCQWQWQNGCDALSKRAVGKMVSPFTILMTLEHQKVLIKNGVKNPAKSGCRKY